MGETTGATMGPSITTRGGDPGCAIQQLAVDLADAGPDQDAQRKRLAAYKQ